MSKGNTNRSGDGFGELFFLSMFGYDGMYQVFCETSTPLSKEVMVEMVKEYKYYLDINLLVDHALKRYHE